MKSYTIIDSNFIYLSNEINIPHKSPGEKNKHNSFLCKQRDITKVIKS